MVERRALFRDRCGVGVCGWQALRPWDQGGLSGEAAQKPRLQVQTHRLSRGGDTVTHLLFS